MVSSIDNIRIMVGEKMSEEETYISLLMKRLEEKRKLRKVMSEKKSRPPKKMTEEEMLERRLKDQNVILHGGKDKNE